MIQIEKNIGIQKHAGKVKKYYISLVPGGFSDLIQIGKK